MELKSVSMNDSCRSHKFIVYIIASNLNDEELNIGKKKSYSYDTIIIFRSLRPTRNFKLQIKTNLWTSYPPKNHKNN